MAYLYRLSGNSPPLRHIGSTSSSPINPSPENTLCKCQYIRCGSLCHYFVFSLVVPPRPLASSTAATYQIMHKGEEEEEWLPFGGHRDRKDRRKIKKERRKSFSGSKVKLTTQVLNLSLSLSRAILINLFTTIQPYLNNLVVLVSIHQLHQWKYHRFWTN